MIRGITKRWMLNTLSVIFTIIVLIVVSLILIVTYVFQNSVETQLNAACNELSLVFSGYTSDSYNDFTSAARDYVENFDQKEKMGVMVINPAGRVVITSTGFVPSESEKMPDFEDAKKRKDGYAFWSGKLSSGEPAMSETRVITNENDAIVGAIRYIVSMEPINSRILLADSAIILIGVIMLTLVVISGLLFIRSIVKPIRRLSETAAQIAQGDFSASEKIEHKYDDEIGDLCKAVSNMAKDLQTTEQMKNDFISRVSHELRTPLTAIKGWAETMQLSGNKKTIEYDFLLPVFPDSVTEMQLRATVINTLGDEWNGTKHFKVFAADYTLTESELSLVEVPAVGKYNGFRFKNGKPERFSTLDANVDETQQHVVIALNENDNKASKGVSSKVPTVRFARVNSFDYANAQYNSVLNTFRSRYNLQDVSASMGNLAVGDIILIGNVDEGKKTATALGVMKVVAVPETNDQEGDVYRFLVKGMGR